MKRIFTLLTAVLLVALYVNAQESKSNMWVKWQFLIGEWEGQGNGTPGEGVGGFSLQPDLDGKVLVRKNHADYPAANGQPAFVHNDLMVVYFNDKNPSAIYFDNEGHVIHYTIAFDDSTGAIILTSPESATGMHFKLSYTPVGKDKVNIKFEMAKPDKPSIYSTYIDAFAIRKK